MKKQLKIQNNPVIQRRIEEYHSLGKSSREIQDTLEKDGFKISHAAITDYLKKIKNMKSDILASDKELTSYVRKSILDTGENLKKVNTILWEIQNDPNITRRFKLDVMKQIMAATKLADELMNEFKGLKIEGNNNKIMMVQLVVDKLNELEAKGDIKILNPALRKNKTEIIVEGEVIKVEKIKKEEDDETEESEEEIEVTER